MNYTSEITQYLLLVCLCLFGTILAETSALVHAKLTSFQTKTGRSCCFVLLFCHNHFKLLSSLLGFFHYFFPQTVEMPSKSPDMFPKAIGKLFIALPISATAVSHCIVDNRSLLYDFSIDFFISKTFLSTLL